MVDLRLRWDSGCLRPSRSNSVASSVPQVKEGIARQPTRGFAEGGTPQPVRLPTPTISVIARSEIRNYNHLKVE